MSMNLVFALLLQIGVFCPLLDEKESGEGEMQTTAIRLLPDEVINKIKAGEMIARPANVVKELIENAIDAKATSIKVALNKGGIDEISVSDNGTGIPTQEVPLSIQRHATSKIQQVDDLYALCSLGFRGEALASMAEVSHFSMMTMTAEANTGTKLTTNSTNTRGEEPVVTSWHGRRGTHVRVRELFFNIPVRRKYMKSMATEYAHCCDCVHAFVMSHTEIEFVLAHNGKEQLRAFTCDKQDNHEQKLRARSESLFGKEIAENLLYCEEQNDIATLTSLFSPPGIDRGHTRHIFTFVNERWVKSQTMKYGILRGYHSHLLKGRYPIYLANLTMHPSLLDVNVHPTKSEIRFQYNKEVQELIALAIRRNLRAAVWSSLPHAPAPTEQDSAFSPTTSSPSTSLQENSKPSAVSAFRSPAHSPAPRLFYGVSSPSVTASPCANSEQKQGKQDTEAINWRSLRYMGSFARCYLLLEDGEEEHLLVVDQHAFHERIIYEQIVADPCMLAKRQQLAIGETVQLAPEEMELVENRRDEFANLGFAIEAKHADAVLVSSVPTILQGKDVLAVLRDLLALAKRDHTAWLGESLVHDVVATIACRSAVKAGDVLDANMRQNLFNSAENVDFFHNCPHGRRVMRIFPKQQVGAWFDRL